MKGFVLTLLAAILFVGLSAQVLSCADIQYTADATGNSPYNNQTVTVRAIVTHVIPNSAFYISDPDGGPWSGLYVFHGNTSNALTVGDDVQLTGILTEYYNLTELTAISSYEIFSQGNPLPPALELSTTDIPYGSPTCEKYEGVLVKLTDVQIKSSVDSYGQFKVADVGNVQAMIDNGLFNITGAYTINVNDWWYSIQGIVDYHSSAGYKINPRNANDMIKQDSIENSIIKIENTTATLNQVTAMNVVTTKIKPVWGVLSYTMKFRFNPTQVRFEGFEGTGTLTPTNPEFVLSATGDTVSYTVMYQDGLFANEDGAVLTKLLFVPLAYGEATIDILSFKYDNYTINSLTDGKLMTKIAEKIAYLNIGSDTNTKNIFNPYLNEKINIQYGVKTGYLAKAIVRIYDAQGRLVYTPVNVNITSPLGIETFPWNGRDSNMKLLPVGLYYCHLEVIDRSTGSTERTVQPIVIKSSLK
ncbi:MAG: hypothetical protein RBS43_01495 [Candidatus Cloacimonas sp.]|jgi:hypothetical protein|nr:hypothetical protein [Candidatus Cloacimonas sp.]